MLTVLDYYIANNRIRVIGTTTNKDIFISKKYYEKLKFKTNDYSILYKITLDIYEDYVSKNNFYLKDSFELDFVINAILTLDEGQILNLDEVLIDVYDIEIIIDNAFCDAKLNNQYYLTYGNIIKSINDYKKSSKSRIYKK